MINLSHSHSRDTDTNNTIDLNIDNNRINIHSIGTDTNNTINLNIDNNRINIHTCSSSISLSIHDSKRLKRKLNDCIKFCEINKELSE